MYIEIEFGNYREGMTLMDIVQKCKHPVSDLTHESEPGEMDYRIEMDNSLYAINLTERPDEEYDMLISVIGPSEDRAKSIMDTFLREYDINVVNTLETRVEKFVLKGTFRKLSKKFMPPCVPQQETTTHQTLNHNPYDHESVMNEARKYLKEQ